MGCYDLGLSSNGAYGHPAFWAVESTGPELKVGLKESWYAIKAHVMSNGKIAPGVFDIFRGSKGTNSTFRIVALLG